MGGSSREAIRRNRYFEKQARWLRWEYAALFATAANLVVLSFTGPNVRSNLIVITWTVALVVTDFVLLAKWLTLWHRMWAEQNRIEARTSSDRAVARLRELLGARYLPAKVMGIGAVVAILLIPVSWGVSPTLALVCSGIALCVSLLLAWSLDRHE
jgi:hypothetical protein